jgi:hypothetical protein
MNDPDPFHKYGELAAGHALPTTIHPTISAPAALTTPTDVLIVDGVQLAVADRLAALARVRDQHRATLRAVGDRRRAMQDRADDLIRRIRLLDQHKYSGAMSPTVLAEKSQLEADLAQIRAASRALDAEDGAATASFGDADLLLKSALRFARAAGATVPVMLEKEGR